MFLSKEEREEIYNAGTLLDNHIKNEIELTRDIYDEIDKTKKIINEKMGVLQFSPLLLFTSIYCNKKITLNELNPINLNIYIDMLIDKMSSFLAAETFSDPQELILELLADHDYSLDEENYLDEDVLNILYKIFYKINLEEISLYAYSEMDGISFIDKTSIEIYVSSLNRDTLTKLREETQLTYADSIHMVIAHECTEAIYGLNIQKVNDITRRNLDVRPTDGEFLASQMGMDLFLHHAVRHNKMHRVPRFYTFEETRDELIQEMIEAVKRVGRNVASEEWEERLATSIQETLNIINQDDSISRLPDCPRNYGGLRCHKGHNLMCPEDKMNPCGFLFNN